MKRLMVLFLVLLSMVGCKDQKNLKKIDLVYFDYFDTIIDITYFGDEKNRDEINNKIESKIREVHYLLDGFDTMGQIASVNKNNKTDDREIVELVRKTVKNEEMTNHVTDITRGELFELWRDALETGVLPDDKKIKAARDRDTKLLVDENSIEIDDSTILDVGSICKGYLNDILASYIKSLGIDNFIINSGGNVTVVGKNIEKNREFSVGIQDPFGGTAPYSVFYVDDISVVTSGNYERYREIDGKLYHHIIDLNTGYPAQNGKKSVTILGKDAYICDFLSTAIFLTDDEDIDGVMEKYKGYSYYIIYEDGRVRLSDEVKKYMRK